MQLTEAGTLNFKVLCSLSTENESIRCPLEIYDLFLFDCRFSYSAVTLLYRLEEVLRQNNCIGGTGIEQSKNLTNLTFERLSKRLSYVTRLNR